jgi:hypothetical protein
MEAGLAPELTWIFWRSKRPLAPAGNQPMTEKSWFKMDKRSLFCKTSELA